MWFRADDCGLSRRIILNQNLFKVPVTDIHKTKVLKTVLQGKTVYQRN